MAIDDDDDGDAPVEGVYRLLNAPLVLGIKIACRLVQNQDAWLSK
jgi:hypothetical protein